MRTVADMDQELKQLRKRVRQLEGEPNEGEVSEPVGDGSNQRMNPTRSAFSDAVGKAEEVTLAKKGAKAWLKKNPSEADRGGAVMTVGKRFGFSNPSIAESSF
jgi:hypothetical protein